VGAAIALADERGLDAVSMRAVAERVGVTPMALYPHVGSKAALLDGMVTAILRDLSPLSRAEASWEDRLIDLARAGRAMTQQRPWVAMLMFSRPSIEPDAARVTDAVYQALLDAGIPDADVPRLERMLTTFVIGYGASESAGRFRTGWLDPRGWRGQVPGQPLGAHARLTPFLEKSPDWDAEFEADLADLRLLIRDKIKPAAAPPGGDGAAPRG
jgi:AcrR family transcriptional regulator